MNARFILQPALLVLVLWVAGPAQAEAVEWFVAPGGTGIGTSTSPFGRVQAAINAAQPGDVVTVRSGTYRESVRTVRDGLAEAPIRVRGAGPRDSVLITLRGRVLDVDHAYFIVEGLVLDGQYAPADTVTVSTRGHGLVIRNVEIRRSTQDLIDLSGPRDVLIEQCLIHHALNAAGGRRDAHAIAAGAVQNLTIRDTEIHTFSGDGLQVDPGRAAPGWNDVTVDTVRIWLAPLPADENGFAAGVVPGENAIDTKASATLPRSRLTVRNTTARGFRGGLIGNMAAFNLKEHIDATLDRVTVHDSEIAFRMRGATASTPAGAWVTVTNAVVFDVATAFRYEDAIETLRIWNSTVGRGVERAFRAANAGREGLDVRNLLVLGASPDEAAHPSNLRVGAGAFVDAGRNDYRLSAGSAAIDAGERLPGVTTDRIGTLRPQGGGPDAGAYEWLPGEGTRR